MFWQRKIIFGVALAVASTAALAFQEERQGQGSPQAAAPAAKLEDARPATGEPGKAANAGTEVSIPGLGKLGVIPRMNFGLELLYGATETKRTEEAQPQDQEGLTIRGSIKHRF